MPAPELTNYDLARYDRQILIRGLGEEGQRKLKGARALIAGCGGLGSPIALYLAAAGVGTLVIADNDIVDLSNLNRQVLHWDKNVGEAKVKSAYEKLAQANPTLNIVPFEGCIDANNVLELAKGCDVIMDALDNFETRYLLNRASLYYKIPLVHGSIWGLEGRATTLVPGRTPCLECLFPKAPPKETFPVLGATPGVIGTIQVTEAIKLLTGIGTTLENRLLVYDGEYMEFHEIKVAPNPDCPACSKNAQK